MLCTLCGNKMKRVNKTVRQRIAGIDFQLKGLKTPSCDCGNEEIAIPAIKNLHTLVAEIVICHVNDVRGEQIKFLRKYLKLNQEKFHALVSNNPSSEVVSRWEANKAKPNHAAILLIKKLVQEYIFEERREYENLVETITHSKSNLEAIESLQRNMTLKSFLLQHSKMDNNVPPNLQYNGDSYAICS